MRIKHNIPAKNSYRNLSKTNRSLSKSLEKLSTGYRINRAADDAAGLAISEKMRAQISSLDQAQDNASHGIGFLNVMDGALQEYQNILQRMNVLALQSSNGTLEDTVDRPAIQSEFGQLRDELTRIANCAEYNSISCFSPTIPDIITPEKPTLDIVFVLDRTGSMGTHIKRVADNLELFINQMSNADLRIGLVDYSDYKTPPIETHPFSTDFNQVKATLNTMAGNTPGAREDGLDAIMKALDLGFRPDAARHIILLGDEVITSSNNVDEDDVAQKLKDTNAKLTVIGRADRMSAQFQGTDDLSNATNFIDKIQTDFSTDLVRLGGNIASTLPQDKPTTLVDLDPIILQIGDTADQTLTINRYHMLPSRYGLDTVGVSTAGDAVNAIKTVLDAINGVSAYRAELGAATNRLEHTINNLGVTVENLTDAESTIRDTDMATEYANYIKSSIISQSAQAMLAQANQVPQHILTLMQ